MDITELQDMSSVKDMLKALRDLGIYRLDTGARYPPLQPGRAEEPLGEASELIINYNIDINTYTDTRTDRSGDLTKEAISKPTTASRQRLKVTNGVNVLHAYRADPSTSLKEQVHGFNQETNSDKVKLGGQWGLLNVSLEIVERMLKVCEDKGKFVNHLHEGTRFADNNPLGKAAQGIFGAEYLRTPIKQLDIKLQPYNISPVEVAIRWIAHHSALGDGDWIVIGASKVEQIRQIVGMTTIGPLPGEILDTAEHLWQAVKDTTTCLRTLTSCGPD
ncbi:MAG: hypothetical protein Q9199_003951 [Rusavskia elegans]